MMKLLIVILLSLSIVGCSHPMPSNNTKFIQESLLVQCTQDTPIPAGLSGQDVYKTLNDWQMVYQECALSKDALIKAVRNTNDTN